LDKDWHTLSDSLSDVYRNTDLLFYCIKDYDFFSDVYRIENI